MLKNLFSSLIDELCIDNGSKIIVSVNLLDIFRTYNISKQNYIKCVIYIYEEILDRIGEKGTFITPVFNYQFCRGISFHRNNSPGQSGSFGDILLKNVKIKRTKHPIYSFLVKGIDEDLFINLDNIKAFGNDSPFSYFVKCNYKLITIGHHFIRSNTLIHFAESEVGIKYRFEKIFSGYYFDYENDFLGLKNYSMYVRNLELCDVSGITYDGLNALYSNNIIKIIKHQNKIVSYKIDQANAFKLYYDDILLSNFKLVNCYKSPEINSKVIFGNAINILESTDKLN